MLKSYVIRTGHFTAAQKKSYDSFSGTYLIPFTEEIIDLNNIFANNNGTTLEIGFGSGLATASIAQDNPEKNYLGVEVHRPGIGRLLWEIEKRKLLNIRIIEYNAVDVIEKMIPQGCLEAIHVFFPDPWPKNRHKKRRLIQRPFTEKLSLCLKRGGYLYMVTDWEDYALFALEELSTCSNLVNKFACFAPPQIWRPLTRFEKKGLENNNVIRELFFTRK